MVLCWELKYRLLVTSPQQQVFLWLTPLVVSASAPLLVCLLIAPDMFDCHQLLSKTPLVASRCATLLQHANCTRLIIVHIRIVER
jgi:hypothetical protein